MRSKARKVRYAVVGAGNIAQVAVLPAFAHAKENSELVAIVSGDEEKRAALRERYGLELDGGYEDYEGILARGRIDAVYIATPNTLHKEYALRAASAGVHVLCEKPLAPTVQDCATIASTCQENGVKLMVAYRLHFEEANLKALEIARSNELGDLRLFSSFFSHVVRQDDIRRKPELAGGAAYDLGVYCINAARNFFEGEPISVYATAVKNNDTDDTTAVLLNFPSNRIAQFCISNSTADVSTYRIAGSRGDLRVEPAYDYAGEIVHYLTLKGKTRRQSFEKRDQFAPELVYFSECIQNDTLPEPSAEEGMRDVRVIEAILRSIDTGGVVELTPLPRREVAPSLAQEMRKPPLEKPETVKAPGPSVR